MDVSRVGCVDRAILENGVVLMDAAGDFGKLLVAQRRSYDGNDGNPWESMELNQEFCPEQGSLQYDNMIWLVVWLPFFFPIYWE